MYLLTFLLRTKMYVLSHKKTKYILLEHSRSIGMQRVYSKQSISSMSYTGKNIKQFLHFFSVKAMDFYC